MQIEPIIQMSRLLLKGDNFDLVGAHCPVVRPKESMVLWERWPEQAELIMFAWQAKGRKLAKL